MTPRKYRLKGSVEAARVGMDYDDDLAIVAWCGGDFFHQESDYLFGVWTDNGLQEVRSGDWVVKYGPEDFEVMSDQDFKGAYEEVPWGGG